MTVFGSGQQTYDMEQFTKDNAVSGGACQFIKFLQSGADEVKKNDPEGCRGGDYLIKGKAYSKLHVQVGPARPKATYWPRVEDGGSGNLEAQSFDPTSETFKQISAMNKRREKGCSVGLEFLLWCYEAQTFGILDVKGNSFNRGNHEPLGQAANEGKIAVIIGDYIPPKKKGGFSWHNIKVDALIDAESYTDFAVPDQEAVDSALEFFNKPPKDKPFATAASA